MSSPLQRGGLVLDTNVISEPLRPRPDAQVLRYLQGVSSRTFVTSVTIAELMLGAHLLDDGRRKAALLHDVAAVRDAYATRTLSFTASAAEHYGAAIAGLQRAGRTMAVADAYIAAICVTNDATLVTRNTRDFENYPDLQIINPWDSPEGSGTPG